MRRVISLLCLLLAGVLSAAALAGHQVDQLLREPEPVREIAGALPEDEAFSEAVSQMLVEQTVSSLPDALGALVPGGLEHLVGPVVDQALNNERTIAAWDEVLQTTRQDYTAQLEGIFARGTTGDVRELDLSVELTPVTDAMTAPLREQAESVLQLLPGLDAEDVEIPTPEFVVDIEAATDESADPYTWATAAAASQHWMLFAGAAAVLAALGLAIGPRRTRWIALAVGALTAGALGLWIATTAASPDLTHSEGMPQAAAALLEHVQTRFTEWAQPSWWIFTGVCGFLAVMGVLAAVAVPRVQPRPVDWRA